MANLVVQTKSRIAFVNGTKLCIYDEVVELRVEGPVFEPRKSGTNGNETSILHNDAEQAAG